tara:strand:- start:811 stop:2070 length:1260 start_codon:yes stop_codon:yes gene_type:complete
MNKIIYYQIIIALVLTIPFTSLAKSNYTDTKIKIFLDCEECDFSYFRRNISFVEFVRAPQLADINVLVTDQETGSGGNIFYFQFKGMNQFDQITYQVFFNSEYFFTEIQERDGLLKTLKMGLIPYLIGNTSLTEKLNIEYDESLNNYDLVTKNPDDDPWNYWLINVGGDLSFSKQELQSQKEFGSNFDLNRITEKLKFKSDLDFNRVIQEFNDDGVIIKSRITWIDSDIDLVYSLGPKWSLGAFSGYTRSTYANIDAQLKFNLGLEYNIFKWDKSDKKVFTLTYLLGLKYNDYFEETIFDKKYENIYQQNLRLYFLRRQNWGNIEATARINSFLNDFSKNRMRFELEGSFRLSKIISLFGNINLESIHDQVFLSKSILSTQDLLLKQRQLPTDFNLSMDIGIELTFGSIYNNVVNPRFD